MSIAITAEILSNCKINGVNLRQYRDQKAFIIGEGENGFVFFDGYLNKAVGDEFVRVNSKRFEFIHELQSAILVLTGEELNINL